jgi:hypothetical protein
MKRAHFLVFTESGRANKSQSGRHSLLCLSQFALTLLSSVHFFSPAVHKINDELNAIKARIKAANDAYVPTSASNREQQPFRRRPTFPDGTAEFSPEEAELEAYVERKATLVAAVHAVRSFPSYIPLMR